MGLLVDAVSYHPRNFCGHMSDSLARHGTRLEVVQNYLDHIVELGGLGGPNGSIKNPDACVVIEGR